MSAVVHSSESSDRLRSNSVSLVVEPYWPFSEGPSKRLPVFRMFGRIHEANVGSVDCRVRALINIKIKFIDAMMKLKQHSINRHHDVAVG